MKNKFIAVLGLTNSYGIGIVKIDPNEEVVYVQDSGTEKEQKVCKCSLYTNSRGTYFVHYRHRYYLEEFICVS